MFKALITAALAAWMASASAYSDSSDQPPPPPFAGKPSAAKSTPMKLQAGAGADSVKVRAVYSPDIRPNPPQAFSLEDEPAASESGWRSYGMLLATLVLMAVIAVRRYKAERP